MKTTKLNDCFQIRFPHPNDLSGYQGMKADHHNPSSDPSVNYQLVVLHVTRAEFAAGGCLRNMTKNFMGVYDSDELVWDLEIDIPPSKVRTDEDPEECVNVSIQRISGIVQATIGINRVQFLVQDEYENLPTIERGVLLNYNTPLEVGHPFGRDPNYTVAFEMTLEDSKPSVVKFHN